jgi:hypothetical protein
MTFMLLHGDFARWSLCYLFFVGFVGRGESEGTVSLLLDMTTTKSGLPTDIFIDFYSFQTAGTSHLVSIQWLHLWSH